MELHPRKNKGVSWDIHHAVRTAEDGVIERISALEENSKILDKTDEFGYTPIHCAAQYGHYDILNALIEKRGGAGIPHPQQNFTVLHILALKNVKALNEIGSFFSEDSMSHLLALVEKTDYNECNSLHFACRTGNVAIVDMIMQNSNHEDFIMYLKHENVNSESPLHEACRFGCDTLIKKIKSAYDSLEKFLLALCKASNKAPIHIACREGSIKLLRFLFSELKGQPKFKELINAKDDKGKTPLHYACELEDDAVVALLHDYKAKIFSDYFGITPLHIAVQFGSHKVVLKLLECFDPADLVNKKDHNYETPLYYAAKFNNREVIPVLLSHNAIASNLNKELRTPLLCAAIQGHMEFCDALAKNKVSLEEVDVNGKNILHIAAEKNDVSFLKFVKELNNKIYEAMLNSSDNNFNTPLHLAALKGNIASVTHLLESKSDKEFKNKHLQTPIHCAAAKGQANVLETLLKRSRRSLIKDGLGNTPLHLSCQNGHYQATKLLLFHQAGFNTVNNNGRTPLHLAAENGHESIVMLLYEVIFESNPKILNELVNSASKWIPPLHLAVVGGHLSIVEYFLNNNILQAQIDIEIDLRVHEDIANTVWPQLTNAYDQCTPIQIAIQMNDEEIVSTMMKCKQWEAALNCEWVTYSDFMDIKTPTTALKEIIIKMPKTALLVLDQCKFKNFDEGSHLDDHYTAKEIFKRFKYDCCNKIRSSLPTVASRHKRNHPVQIMIDNNRKELLKHPLTRKFVDWKWKKFGERVHAIGLLYIMLFIIFLTSFALTSPNPQETTCQAIFSGEFGRLRHRSNYSKFNNSDSYKCIQILNVSDMEEQLFDLWSENEICSNLTKVMECGYNEECGVCSQAGYIVLIRRIIAAIIYFMAFLLLVYELLLMFTRTWLYFLDITNYVTLSLLIYTCLFTSSAFRQCGCASYFQWQFGILSVFLAWIILGLRLHYIPIIGIQIIMLQEMFFSFLKTAVLALLLVVAFAITFYMAFHVPSPDYNRSPFYTPLRAHLKLMSMTAGEGNFDRLFRLSFGSIDSSSSDIPFPVSYLLWILFLVLMPILLSNLLNALAIYDIKDLREQSDIKLMDFKITILVKIEEGWKVLKRKERNRKYM